MKVAILAGWFVVIFFSCFGYIKNVKAVDYMFTEDFSKTIYKDTYNTSAHWNTKEGKISLDLNVNINDWSSRLQNFTGMVSSIANNNYIQLIGGGGGFESSSLNQTTSYGNFEDKAQQLINFQGNQGLNARVIDIDYSLNKSNLQEGSYWLIAGGYFFGAEPKLNKLQLGNFTDLSSFVKNLGMTAITNMACNDYYCLIGGKPGKVFKYDGKIFEDLSSNVDFNNNGVQVAWNGTYWLIGGTKYPFGSNNTYSGRIYKYDGSDFVRITDDTMFIGGWSSEFDMSWSGTKWLIARGYSPIQLYVYDEDTFQDFSSQINKYKADIIDPTLYWDGQGWLIGGGGYFEYLLWFDGASNMIDIYEHLDTNGVSINVIASKYTTNLDPFLIGGNGGSTAKLFSGSISGYDDYGTVQSLQINKIDGQIQKATLSAGQQLENDMEIDYFMTANGGINWEQVQQGKEHTFLYPGNSLKWKAELKQCPCRLSGCVCSTFSPIISMVIIDYTVEAIDDLFIKVNFPTGTLKGGSLYTFDVEMFNAPSNSEVFLYLKRPNGTMKYDGTSLKDGGGVTDANGYCQMSILLKRLDDYGISGRWNFWFQVAGQETEQRYFDVDFVLREGSLVKVSNNPKVYVIREGKKQWIKTIEEFQRDGYKWEDVQEVSAAVIESYENYAESILLRAKGNYKVYRIVGGKKIWIPTAKAFESQGLKWDGIEDIDKTELELYSRAKLLRANGDTKVYYITEGGLKRHIPTAEVFNSYGNKWADIVDVDAEIIDTYEYSTLIRAEGGFKVYKIENGQKRWIKTAAAFNKLKYDWNQIGLVNETELNSYKEGVVIE